MSASRPFAVRIAGRVAGPAERRCLPPGHGPLAPAARPAFPGAPADDNRLPERALGAPARRPAEWKY
jgi:hypothetical protein